MKNLLFTITMLTVVSTQARSLMPHKPYRTATMKVTEASGEFSNATNVILTEWSYPVQDQSQALREGNLLVLQINGEELGAMINKVEDAGCGSKKVIANTFSQGQKPSVSDQLQIELIDHSTRVCEDLQPNMWVAKVTLTPLSHHRLISCMEIQGNPRPAQSQVLAANIEPKLIDPNVWFAKGKLSTGTVTVDLSNNFLKLFVPRKSVCPPGRACTMNMLAPVMISLNITEIKKGECGTTIYVAKQDMRPADGMLEVLEVSDNSEFYKHCQSNRAVPGVEISYDTKSMDMRTHSEFTGDYLKPIAQ